MGCNSSTTKVSVRAETASRSIGTLNENVQDEARSFRSKVSAIKMLARQQSSYESFFQYLEDIGKSEYLVCFRDIEEIKKLEEDQMISRTYALVCRYKALYEEFKISLIEGNNNSDRNFRSKLASYAVSSSKHLVWECFGKLKSLDYTNTTGEVIYKYLVIAENDLISRLVVPLESYLASPFYKSWQDEQLDLEKKRNLRNKSISQNGSTLASSPRSNIPTSPSSTMLGIDPAICSSSLKPSSTNPNTSENFFNSYADILIVDDSNITLKLTGKTLEQDGHHVEKATNGQIALNLMKSRPYDVVLIDCNMPVMDGFEAVRLFREFEKENSKNTMNLYFPSDVSSISDSQEDPAERTARSQQQQQRQAEQNGVKAPEKITKNPAFNPSSKLNPVPIISEEAMDNVTDLRSKEANLQIEGKLKKVMTAANYHQLIIGMSTNIDEETRKRALGAGMDYFLPKPFTLQKFMETIKLSREQKEQQQQQDAVRLKIPSTGEITSATAELTSHQ
jgi:CheY-like chemotaxis protein